MTCQSPSNQDLADGQDPDFRKETPQYPLLRAPSMVRTTFLLSLMIAYNRRYLTSSTDFLGRGWEWIFATKDMPFSETSIHHTASQQFAVSKQQLGNRVLRMRVLFVAIGEDEAHLMTHLVSGDFYDTD